MNTGHEKTPVMGYRTLYEGSGIHHANSGLQITHDMFINGYFMLLFDLTPEHSVSDWHTSLSENGNIRIDLKIDTQLANPVTYLLHIECDGSIQIDR